MDIDRYGDASWQLRPREVCRLVIVERHFMKKFLLIMLCSLPFIYFF